MNKNKITDIKGHNPELYFGTNGFNTQNMPMCESCLLNDLCSHPCLGSNYETTGDIFIPHPNVCRMEFFKTKGIDIYSKDNR
jgi:radical SAM protein with 4Fe4S-binding SPASM domain